MIWFLRRICGWMFARCDRQLHDVHRRVMWAGVFPRPFFIGTQFIMLSPGRQERQGSGKKVTEDEIGKEVVDTAVHIHYEIGPGLLELVYEVVLAHELRGKGLRLADKRLGYLLDFDEALMKHGITRIVNRLQEQGLIPWRSWRLGEREGFSSAPTNSADEPIISICVHLCNLWLAFLVCLESTKLPKLRTEQLTLDLRAPSRPDAR